MITEVQLHLPGIASPAPKLSKMASTWGRSIWRFLEAIGASRARGELLRVASANDRINPELAARLRTLAREDWLAQN